MRAAMFANVTGFADFESTIGIERDVLSSHLSALVGAQLMTEVSGSFRLTEQGRNLEPVIIALSTWSDGWSHAPEPRMLFTVHEDAVVETPGLVSPDDPVSADALIIEMTLLGAFSVRVGGKVIDELAVGSQRLLVFLALHHRAVTRIAMAGQMWPEATDERAGISLRSALSRLDVSTRESILSASAGLSLLDTVAVDLRAAQALAGRLLRPGGATDLADLDSEALATLSSDVLPDWYDDWVLAEADEWRQLRMNALEALSAQLAAIGRLAEAAAAARAAMKVEPLRESANAALVRVYLAEGNQSEALRVYDGYTKLLHDVLGLVPTAMISDLVVDLRSS
ncbi:MAG: transcriptional regulator, family [Microbacteriaceae bacterium]|nr:transcriptional regulator, family [Microbacteriaceae bacterium]